MKTELYETAFILELKLISALSNGGDMHSVIGLLSAESFTSDQTRLVWSEMCKVHAKGQKVDSTEIFMNLARNELFQDKKELTRIITGDDSIIGIAIPRHTKEYGVQLAKIHSRIYLADLVAQASAQLDASENEEPIEKVLHELREGIDSVKVTGGFKQASNLEIIGQLIDDVYNPPKVTKTGIKSYDRIIGGGFVAGEAYTLAGRPKAGKTMLAGTISYNLNQSGSKHAYLCLEMGFKQIMQRQFARYADASTSIFMRDETKNSDLLANKLIEFQGDTVLKQNQHFVNCPTMRMSEAKAMLYRLKMDGYEGVIIDYFQLIAADLGFRGNKNELQDVMAQEVIAIAKDLGLWVLIIAQMNNDGKTYGSGALLRACTHSAGLEICDGEGNDQGFRWLRTMFSRFTQAEDIGSEMEAGLRIHRNGSHIEELI